MDYLQHSTCHPDTYPIVPYQPTHRYTRYVRIALNVDIHRKELLGQGRALPKLLGCHVKGLRDPSALRSAMGLPPYRDNPPCSVG